MSTRSHNNYTLELLLPSSDDRVEPVVAAAVEIGVTVALGTLKRTDLPGVSPVEVVGAAVAAPNENPPVTTFES